MSASVDDRVQLAFDAAVGLQWHQTTNTTGHETFQVLRLRDGKVVEEQDHLDRRAALRAVGASV